MKKRITSLLLVLAMCFVMLPTAAFAADEQETQGTQETQGAQEPQGSEPNAEPNDEQPEEPSEEPIRTSITTVDDLMKFAKEAQDGRYDGKTDSVVSLDADLDLTGRTWVPIAGRPIGNAVPCFSGTFYGNNHVISGLDLSSAYNEQQHFAGLFGALWKAKVYDLTVKGSFDATESDGSFRDAALVSPLLYLILQAVGYEIASVYMSERPEDISAYYSGRFEEELTVRYKREYDTFFKEINSYQGEYPKVCVNLQTDVR